jgi:hypothetical protein
MMILCRLSIMRDARKASGQVAFTAKLPQINEEEL